MLRKEMLPGERFRLHERGARADIRS